MDSSPERIETSSYNYFECKRKEHIRPGNILNCRDPMGVLPSKDDAKTGMVTEITEHTMFFGPWACMKSFDNSKIVEYRDMKGVIQSQP